MNIFDVIIILMFCMFFITGFKRGIIKETASLIGIILVFTISFSLKGVLGNFLCNILPFFEFSGAIEGITAINILLYQLVAFIIIFTLLYSVYEIVMKISKVLQKIVNMTIVLWIPSKIAGGIISLVKGYIILFAVFLALMFPLKDQDIFKESKLVNSIINKTPILSSSTDELTQSINDIYSLSSEVADKKISSEEANRKTLDILLRYKIVSKTEAEKLIEQEKIENTNDIKSILNKY